VPSQTDSEDGKANGPYFGFDGEGQSQASNKSHPRQRPVVSLVAVQENRLNQSRTYINLLSQIKSRHAFCATSGLEVRVQNSVQN
jgi:hypothetical protein